MTCLLEHTKHLRIKTKKFWVLSFVLTITAHSLFSQTEIKLNLATASLLIPNVGIEIPLADRKAVQLDVLGSFWDEMPLLDDAPLHITQTFLEYRWYQKPNREQWFIGPHIGFGMFTLQKPKSLILFDYYEEIEGPSGPIDEDEYQSGRVAFYGVTLGYKKRLNNQWALEAFIGAGLSQSWYKGYKGLERVDHLGEPEIRPFNGSGEVLMYRGGVMLVYKIPNFATKEKTNVN
jgi:hypothetical protein